MSEYIINIPNECFSVCDGIIHDRYYPDERHDPMPLEEIVRCRECKFKDEPWNCAAPYYVEPDGFCAWAERRTNDN